MRNINIALFGLVTIFSMNSSAITIEEMAEKSNKIIELDQEIAIAEKNKKLVQIKSETPQPETISLSKIVTAKSDVTISVLSVHGSPSDPLVDIQYGDTLLQKRRGDALPDGWKLSTIGTHTVTISKKGTTKSLVIGYGIVSTPQGNTTTELPIAIPTHATVEK